MTETKTWNNWAEDISESLYRSSWTEYPYKIDLGTGINLELETVGTKRLSQEFVLRLTKGKSLSQNTKMWSKRYPWRGMSKYKSQQKAKTKDGDTGETNVWRRSRRNLLHGVRWGMYSLGNEDCRGQRYSDVKHLKMVDRNQNDAHLDIEDNPHQNVDTEDSLEANVLTEAKIEPDIDAKDKTDQNVEKSNLSNAVEPNEGRALVVYTGTTVKPNVSLEIMFDNGTSVNIGAVLARGAMKKTTFVIPKTAIPENVRVTPPTGSGTLVKTSSGKTSGASKQKVQCYTKPYLFR